MEDGIPIYLGRVTYIVDLDYFYMHIGTPEQLEGFSLLEGAIAEHCETASCINSINDISEGQLVLADCQDTYGCWRRGQVTRIDLERNSADVFYIDYGETENVEEVRICSDLQPEFLTFPTQALRCCIAGIRPIAKKWTTRAVKIFDQQTKIKIFNTVILRTENMIFKVALYSREGDERCLSHVLVDEELGFPVEDEVTEFFKDAQEFFACKLTQTTADSYSDYNQVDLIKEEINCDSEINALCETDGDYSQQSGTTLDNISSEFSDSASSNKTLKPSSMLQNVTAAIQSSINSNNSNNQHGSFSHEIIPQFNFESLHKTHKTTTDKLLEKKQKQTQEALQIEIERVKLETKEQAKLAEAAGYGGLEDLTSLKIPTPKSPGEDWNKELQQEDTRKLLRELSPPPVEKRNTPHGRELLHILNQIFADSERDPADEIRVRLRSLFGTDGYLSLNREEMADVLNTIINRAVRYYGDIHDIILEILEILSGAQFFQECLLDSMKRVQDMYIKIQYKGKPFHVQCSKILGHLFNMSFHWSSSYGLQEYVASLLEKWIMFNKKAQQIGTDRLQEIYLECFETIWEISGVALLDTVENVRPRLLKECRDKILNTDVSKIIRSRTLHIYVLLNIKQKIKLTSEQEVQTEIYKTDVSCQTEQKVEVQSHDTHNSIYQKSARLPFFPPKTKLSDKTSSRSSTPNSLKDYTEKVDAEDLWPSLPKPSGNSLKTAKLNSPIRSSPIFPVVTRSLSPADPLLLLAPSSFSDNSNDNSSSPNSSIYYSVNDNSAILKDYDDSLQQRSRSNLNSPCEMIQHKQKEDSPLSKLIEMDAKADWSDKNKTLKPESHTPKSVKEQVVVEYSSKRKSPLHVQQRKKVPDWWDPDQEEVTQEKVKDHWDMSDSEDTSENISIKSGQTTTSLDSVAGWMMNSGNKQNELVPPSSTKSKSSHSHNITVEATKGLNSHEGLNRFTSKQFTGNKDTVQGQSSINHNDKLFFAKHSDAEMKKNIELSTIGVDKTNDDDSDSDEVDDDDDEDWETCTTDEISEAKSCDSLSCELPVDDAALNNNKQPVTIIREYTESAEKPKPSWKPSGTRKCTACGDTTHLIYDCPNRHNRRFFY